MAEQQTTQVEVPYVLNDPVIEAEHELKQVGLSWQLFGDVRQPSFVRSQSPFPGHFVAKGSKVELYCVHGPTP